MPSTTSVSKSTSWQILSNWLFFPISDKLKMSIKVSLSFTLAYMIPLYFGWPSASTGAITIMLIAAMDSVGDSIQKGFHRIIGSIIGACIGLPLIALFAQDRMLYLISLSLFLTIFIYLYRAYKSDATIFMLTIIMIMIVFQEGNFDNSFTYATNRILMIGFGVLVYTAVCVFLWPVNVHEMRLRNAKNLSSKQKELFLDRDEDDKNKDLIGDLHKSEESLFISTLTSSDETGSMSMSADQWNSVVYSYKEISRTLTLLTYHYTDISRDQLPSFVDNYNQLESETLELLENLHIVWDDQKEFNIPDAFEVVYNTDKIVTLDHLSKAKLLTTIDEINKLHAQLRKLATKINRVTCTKPTVFINESIPSVSMFNWFDMDDIKVTFVSILAFWTFVFIWIYFNPPGGFVLVTFAVVFSLVVLNSTINTLVILTVFTFSFIYGIVMYVFVLSNLHYGWELTIFIFLYAFVGFYIVGIKLVVIFLMSLYLMGISNEMNYDFNLFLLLLFVFYLFLFILLFFYYIPFSTRPEDIFLNLKKRYFSYVKIILLEQNAVIIGEGTWLGSLKSKYALYHLTSTMKKMQLWGSKIDTKYFDDIDQRQFLTFIKECETLSYLLEMMYGEKKQINDNSLIKAFKTENSQVPLDALLDQYTGVKKRIDIDPVWTDKKQLSGMIERKLEDFLSNKKRTQYSDKEIIDFYENISLGNHVWHSLLNCHNMMKELDFKVLEKSRF